MKNLMNWFHFNPLSTNTIKWSNKLKQFVDNLPNCLSAFDHFMRLALNGLTHFMSLVSFYTPWKTPENQTFPHVSRGYRKKPVA